LAAPILVAFVTFESHGDVAGHTGSAFGNVSLQPSLWLPALFLPYAYGPIFSWLNFDHAGELGAFWSVVGGYLGVSLVLLALIALLGMRRRPERRLRIALGLWLVLAVGRSFGMPGARQVVNAIPGIKLTAFFRYSPPSWTLAAVVLSCLALDDIRARRHFALTAVVGAISAVGILYSVIAAVRVHDTLAGAPNHLKWLYGSIAFAIFAIGICLTASVLRWPTVRASVLTSLMVVEALVYFVVPQLAAPRSASLATGSVAFLEKNLGTSRFFTLGPIEPDYGSYWGVASLAINDVPIAASFGHYVTQQLDDNVSPGLFQGTVKANPQGPSVAQEFVSHFRNYERAGVKYLVLFRASPVPIIPGLAPLPVVYEDQIVKIAQLPDPGPFYSPGAPTCVVLSGSEDRVQVDCSSAGALIRREQYLAGWTAVDNGIGQIVKPYDSVFQQIRLHAGRNTVIFSFEPPYADWSLWLFLLGVLVLGVTVSMRVIGGPAAHRRGALSLRFAREAAPTAASIGGYSGVLRRRRASRSSYLRPRFGQRR
jgi:hypothetical protein